MKFFVIESKLTLINLENVCDISFAKDEYVTIYYTGGEECVNYTMTAEERKKLLYCLAQNTIN